MVAVGHRVAAARLRLGHQLTSVESQALTGLLAPARAPPSGRSPGASTVQPGGYPRASAGSWLSGSPPTPWALGPAGFPLPRSRLPPSGVSQLATTAARALSRAPSRLPAAGGLARTAATGLLAALLPPLAFCRHRAVDLQTRSWAGS